MQLIAVMLQPLSYDTGTVIKLYQFVVLPASTLCNCLSGIKNYCHKDVFMRNVVKLFIDRNPVNFITSKLPSINV